MLPISSAAFALLLLPAFAPAPQPDPNHGPLPEGAVKRLGPSRFCLTWMRGLAFSVDGKSIISGGGDGCIHVWQAKSGQRVRSFRVCAGSLYYVLAIHAKSNRVVTGTSTGDIDVWNLATHKRVHRLKGHTGAISSLAISDDGK